MSSHFQNYKFRRLCKEHISVIKLEYYDLQVLNIQCEKQIDSVKYEVNYLHVDNIFRIYHCFGYICQTLITTIIVLQLSERLKFEILGTNIIHEIQMFFNVTTLYNHQIYYLHKIYDTDKQTYPCTKKIVNFVIFQFSL